MDVFVGQICAFGFNYAPIDFMQCQGQILPLQQYSTLFAVLGTQYGGNGTSNFWLPNLTANRALCFGAGAGLPSYNVGNTGGSKTAAMTISNMANHTHATTLTFKVDSSGSDGTTNNPQGATPGTTSSAACYSGTAGTNQYLKVCPNNQVVLDVSGTAAPTPFSIQAPALAMTYCIAIYGIFPVRQ